QPLHIVDPTRGVENLRPMVDAAQFDDRIGLLEDMEKGFYKNYQAPNINDHKTTYLRAVGLMKSKEAKAFDLSQEPASAKSAYGGTRFGESVLLARRLIETGVPFVEVTLGGWDTHANNFERVNQLSTQVDNAMSALVNDLKTRGLL